MEPLPKYLTEGRRVCQIVCVSVHVAAVAASPVVM
jgi:hypothetical protein